MRDGRRRHINVREVRAALSAEKVMGILHPNSYYLHLQDSQVSLACMVKGRSSSSELNRLRAWFLRVLPQQSQSSG